MTPEPGQKSFRCLGSCQLIDDPAVSQQIHNRNATHTKASRQGGVFLGINLHDSRFSGQQLCYLSHRRCERDTVRSPRRPEFSQNRAMIAFHKVVKAPLVE